jgi:FAD-linked oxidoreductase
MQMWTNWSGRVTSTPREIATPADEGALQDLVKRSKQVRAVGAGHSFTELVPSEDTIVSLDALTGLLAHNKERCEATVHAGTRLYALGPILRDIGQALPNMGDIDKQSIAGAVSTGTHGSGISLGAIAKQVTGLRLVLADGSTLECSRERDADVLRAACVSLGTLGILAQITLKNIPSFRVKETTKLMALPEFLASVESLQAAHRHVDAWVFPFGGKVIVKLGDITTEAETKYQPDDFSENTMLKFASELSWRFPSRVPFFQKCLGMFVSESTRIGPSYGIYATERRVKFNEMEYHVPSERGPACLEEVCAALRASSERPFFPVEYRSVAGDDLMLSPFGGAARVSIAVHQYEKQDPWPLFRAAEPVYKKHGGRPHWAKMHSLMAADFEALYPEWQAFHKIRRELDPSGKFMNTHLRKIFEPS